MSSLSQLLSSFAVPLQVWLSPEARAKVATPLIDRLGGRAQIHTQPLASVDTLQGPAVLIITAREITGTNTDQLQALARLAHPGRAILIGGTDDRDTLMTGINDWGVVRVISSSPDATELMAAVSDAEATLKREVALETAIDDLDIENTMLASAIDQLEGGLAKGPAQTEANAVTTLASGLAAILEREAERLRLADSSDTRIEGACEGLSLLTSLVDKAHDRAVEGRTDLPPVSEPLDELVDTVKRLVVLQGGERVGGHIGSGVNVLVEPLALVHHLMNLVDRGPQGTALSLEAYRAGEEAIIEIRFADTVDESLINTIQHTAAGPILEAEGVKTTTINADPNTLRIILPAAENPDE